MQRRSISWTAIWQEECITKPMRFWGKLKVGTKVQLVREADNRYDPNAVMVCYNDEEQEEPICLGYIPRSQNNTIALLMDMDYTNIFECRISQIDERAHPEQQVHLVIKILRNKE